MPLLENRNPRFLRRSCGHLPLSRRPNWHDRKSSCRSFLVFKSFTHLREDELDSWKQNQSNSHLHSILASRQTNVLLLLLTWSRLLNQQKFSVRKSKVAPEIAQKRKYSATNAKFDEQAFCTCGNFQGSHVGTEKNSQETELIIWQSAFFSENY